MCLSKEITYMAKDKDNNIGGRKWMSEREAAEYLGVTIRTMQRWRRGIVLPDGSIKPVLKYYQPSHGRIFYDRDELDTCIVGSAR